MSYPYTFIKNTGYYFILFITQMVKQTFYLLQIVLGVAIFKMYLVYKIMPKYHFTVTNICMYTYPPLDVTINLHSSPNEQ